MELLQERYTPQEKRQAQLGVFDLVGELLAVTLEKHDIEIVVDSKGFFSVTKEAGENVPMIKAQIESEEVEEEENCLQIALSGVIQKNKGLVDSFTFLFSLCWNSAYTELLLRSEQGKPSGTNTLWLQFEKKTEQLDDTFFKISLYRKGFSGECLDLGIGKGLLVFDRKQSRCSH